MKALAEIFDIEIEDEALFKKALTHPSFTRDNELSSLENYERLEFLGDAVLKLVISDILFKKYPTSNEGYLTKIRSILVSDFILAKIAKDLKLKKYIIVSKNAEKSQDGYKDSVFACVFEAILGAYFLENKLCELKVFLNRILEKYIEYVQENSNKFHAKELLQEYTQAQSQSLPIYRLVKETGSAHSPVFEFEVKYNDKVLATAKGKSKKEAEQKCAYIACLKLGVINE